MKVFNDLKTRGVVNILNAVNDGLKGIGEALGAVVPATTLQTCIVHLIRNSLDYASWKDRKLLAAALRPFYTAASAEGRRPGAERLRARGFQKEKEPCDAVDRIDIIAITIASSLHHGRHHHSQPR